MSISTSGDNVVVEGDMIISHFLPYFPGYFDWYRPTGYYITVALLHMTCLTCEGSAGGGQISAMVLGIRLFWDIAVSIPRLYPLLSFPDETNTDPAAINWSSLYLAMMSNVCAIVVIVL